VIERFSRRRWKAVDTRLSWLPLHRPAQSFKEVFANDLPDDEAELLAATQNRSQPQSLANQSGRRLEDHSVVVRCVHPDNAITPTLKDSWQKEWGRKRRDQGQPRWIHFEPV